MGFYHELSAYYDEVFAVNTAEMSFIKTQLAGRERLLDVGCGTWNKTVLLAAPGRSITAIDSDEAMVREGMEKHTADGSIHYRQLGMEDVGWAVRAEEFDSALCLGNTVVHLPDTDTVKEFFTSVGQVLSDAGLFIVQIVNYDRIIRENIKELPRLETENVAFERFYQWRQDEMHFLTRLTVKASGRVFENDIVLLPLKSGEMISFLCNAGFSKVELFGNYAGDAYDPDTSFHFIGICRK